MAPNQPQQPTPKRIRTVGAISRTQIDMQGVRLGRGPDGCQRIRKGRRRSRDHQRRLISGKGAGISQRGEVG